MAICAVSLLILILACLPCGLEGIVVLIDL